MTRLFFIRLPTFYIKVVRNNFKNRFFPRMKIEISRYPHHTALLMSIN